MKFNNITLTNETIEQTKHYFINLNKELIRQALDKEIKVNDLDKFLDWKKQSIRDLEENKTLNNFTFLQYAHYLQTGEMLALLK